jgi:hypothetical protein
VTTATNVPAAQLQGVRSWVDAPYHRLPLMDANTRHTKSTVAASSVDTNLPANASMLAATARLAPKTRYNVRVSGYVQATKGAKWVQFKTRIWSFTTAWPRPDPGLVPSRTCPDQRNHPAGGASLSPCCWSPWPS